MLYGEGDFTKTIDISTRAGQDSDCNPASAAGILGTMIGYSNIPEYWKGTLYEVEDRPFSHTDISLNKAYEMTYKHACDMLRKHGNAKIGNAFEIKREDIRPVALEVAFEDLKVSGKLTVEKSIDEVNSFTFVGTGLVVKGYVAGALPTDYTAEMEVYIDGKLHETLLCLRNSITGSASCSSATTVRVGKHAVTFKWKSRDPAERYGLPKL